MAPVCYLLHFARPLPRGKGVVRHYAGIAANLDVRIAQHRDGKGARLTQVMREEGIPFVLARVWPNGSRALERKIKAYKKARLLCPVCLREQPQGLTLRLPFPE
jgi:predicted GIY-YIG superfamily endonuclease